MILVTPILTKINTFDPSLNMNIKFSYSGGQIKKKRLIIKNALTLDLVHDDTQIGMQLLYFLSANSLTPGQYIAQIQVFDFDGNSSELSDSVLFYCYSTPLLEFNNLPNIINRANITLSITYSQEQNDTISELIYYLYDKDKILLSKSSSFYYVEDYTFYGLKDQETYYVRCVGVTTNGMIADTGYAEINVQYVVQPNNMLFKLTNHRCDGYISIDCNIIDIGYEVKGTGEYIIKNGEVILDSNTCVVYNSGFNFSDDFSIFIKARKLPLSKNFFIIESDSDSIGLSIENIAGDYYCKLSAKSAIDFYYRYATMPEPCISDENNILISDNNENLLEEVSVDYEDNYVAVFELKRKNNLYSLKVYYEENGIIVIDDKNE